MNAALVLIGLAGNLTFGQGDRTVLTTPLIEVKQSNFAKPYSYLLYNRVYLGRQYRTTRDGADLRRLPTTYFHDKSPIGLVLGDPNAFPKDGAPPVMVLGMDIGTLAAYAQPGQKFHFSERVPAFVKLSSPDKGKEPRFTFVQDALDRKADVKIFEGEPRDMLEKHGADGFYKVIVVESYKLPVIEVHKELMTKEALSLLMSKLRDDGIVAFHVSNRYYQLAPIIASAANELKLECIVGKDAGDGGRDDGFRYSSEWVMVARDAKHLPKMKNDPTIKIDWRPARWMKGAVANPVESPGDRRFLWTDKGEQSFRGLYRSDPRIDKLYDSLNDLTNWMTNTAGVPWQQVATITSPIREGIRTWSQSSADALNRETRTNATPKEETKN